MSVRQGGKPAAVESREPTDATRTVRALHHFDEIGLLWPAVRSPAGPYLHGRRRAQALPHHRAPPSRATAARSHRCPPGTSTSRRRRYTSSRITSTRRSHANSRCGDGSWPWGEHSTGSPAVDRPDHRRDGGHHSGRMIHARAARTDAASSPGTRLRRIVRAMAGTVHAPRRRDQRRDPARTDPADPEPQALAHRWMR